MPAKRYKVSLRPEERAYLHQVVSPGKAAAYKRTQAQILLQADQSDGGLGWTDQPMCDALHIGRVTGARIRQTFVCEGLDAVLQRKKRVHPPVPKTLDGTGEAQFIALACSAPPEGCKRWTLQLFADKLVELQVVERLSAETVRRTLKNMHFNRG